jgi:hypothetical protein
VADAGHGAKPNHHLLIDVQNGNQKEQGPEQRRAVVLTSLGVGAERAGIVVAHHDDQSGADDRSERL